MINVNLFRNPRSLFSWKLFLNDEERLVQIALSFEEKRDRLFPALRKANVLLLMERSCAEEIGRLFNCSPKEVEDCFYYDVKTLCYLTNCHVVSGLGKTVNKNYAFEKVMACIHPFPCQ